MIRKMLIVFGLILVPQLLMGFGIAYVAGRLGGVTFLGAQLIAIAVGGLAAIAATRQYSSGKSKILMAEIWICFLIVPIVSRSTLIKSYAYGFKHTVLNAGSADEWIRVKSITGELLASDTKKRASLLPPFIRKVYPQRTPYIAVTTEKVDATDNPGISIWWRDSGLCVGIDISETKLERRRTFFRASIGPGLYIVVFEDN
jgi:hypothetical protein